MVPVLATLEREEGARDIFESLSKPFVEGLLGMIGDIGPTESCPVMTFMLS